MNSAPIYFFLDVMPQQTRTSRLPTWVWGISERSSTGQRSPTRPLPVYVPKPQVSSLVHATGTGATGSARGWACAVENLCRRNPPDPCLGAPATTRIIKEQKTATVPCSKLLTNGPSIQPSTLRNQACPTNQTCCACMLQHLVGQMG